MFKVLATSLLLTSVAWPTVGAAQTAEQGLDRLRLSLYDMGFLAIMPSPEIVDGVARVENMRIRPQENASWSLSFETMNVQSDPRGGLSLRPEGPVVFADTTRDLEATLTSAGFEMWIGPETQEGGLEGWSLQIPEAALSVAMGDALSSIQMRDVSYTGEETDRLHAVHEWSALEVESTFQSSDPEGAKMAVRLRDVDGRLELKSGGYLENYPWMAAIQEGMGADARVSWSEAHIHQGEGAISAYEFKTGPFSGSLGQDKASFASQWSVEDATARFSVNGEPHEIANATSAGDIRLPMSPAETGAPFEIDGTATGEYRANGASVPLTMSMALGGLLRVVEPLYTYPPLGGPGQWVGSLASFELATASVTSAAVMSGASGVQASGNILTQGDTITGEMRFESTGTQGLFDGLSSLGAMGEQISAVARRVLTPIFGVDAGVEPDVVTGAWIDSKWTVAP